MKKFAKLFLLTIAGFLFLGFSNAQNSNDIGLTRYPSNEPINSCRSTCPQTALIAILCIILILILSILIMPSWGILKKAGIKPRKSLIPIWNLHTLSDVATSKFYQLLSSLLIILFLSTFIYGFFIYSYNHCCYWKPFPWICGCIFILFFFIFLMQLYCLARKFGLKIFNAILFVLFFPIGVRILSFGNYEYVGNKEKDNNLEPK